MNKIVLVILLMSIITAKSFSQSSDSNSGEYKGLRFEQNLSWEQVKEKARAENKYIFVDVYATWCGPCKKMDKEVYPNWRVADAMKDKFISIKVQMDSTQQDSEYVRKWYANAHRLAEECKILGYPSFLFFAPDGKLIHQDIGYKSVADFIRLTNLATEPRKARYYTQLEEYKKGNKDYPTMGGLAEFTKKLIGNKELADTIARDYKVHYLDMQTEKTVCTRENLDFIGEFNNLIHSKDKFFDLCYHQPNKIDSIKDHKGWAKFQVDQTIIREEIENKVLKNGKAVTKFPDWRRIQNKIVQKYKTFDARLLVLTYKINYYRSSYLDWRLWAKYKDEMINDYPPTPPYGLQIYAGINMYGAWDAFLHCSDQTVLLKALEWIDTAIKLEGPQSDYLDSKANLLYKLGRRKKALSLEKEALTLTPDDKEKNEYYKKMQLGEPTWLQTQTVMQNE